MPGGPPSSVSGEPQRADVSSVSGEPQRADVFVSVYVTASSMAEAENVARHVLEARLAACANAFPLRSWYWWRGALEQAEEVGVLFKTRRALVPRLEAAVKEVHSYSVPCVVAWPIEAGAKAYLEWVAAEADPAKAERKA